MPPGVLCNPCVACGLVPEAQEAVHGAELSFIRPHLRFLGSCLACVVLCRSFMLSVVSSTSFPMCVHTVYDSRVRCCTVCFCDENCALYTRVAKYPELASVMSVLFHIKLKHIGILIAARREKPIVAQAQRNHCMHMRGGISRKTTHASSKQTEKCHGFGHTYMSLHCSHC